MGGLIETITAPVLAAIRRRAVIYGLMSLGGLIVVFAAGYGLDAVRTVLMFRYGAIWASLIVAGMLVVIAVGLFGIALFIKTRRTRPAAARASDPATTTFAAPPYSSLQMATAGAATASVVTAVVVIVKSRAGQALMARIRNSV